MATTNEPKALDEDVALLVPGREVDGLDLPVPGLDAAVAGIIEGIFTSPVGEDRLHMSEIVLPHGAVFPLQPSLDPATIMTTNSSPSQVRQRRTGRRRRSSSVTCSPNSSSLSIAQRPPPPQTTWRYSARSPRDLAGLRFLVLSHIEDLEKKLEKLEPVPDQQSKNGREETLSHHSPASPPYLSGPDNAEDYSSQNSELDFPIEDLRTWVRDSLDQLAHIRSEVSVRLPDLEDIRSHFPDFDFEFELPNVNLDDFRARLSRMEVPNLSSSLTDVKRQIGDLGYEYLPTLSDHLSGLHSQLKSLSLPNSSDFPSRTLDKGNAVLRDFIDALMYNEEDSPLERTRVDLEVKQTVVQIHEALHSSMNGTRLITYEQLPSKWQNNEHVTHGYRFIPASSWPSLLLSVFQLHNETVNIHTHLLPFAVLCPIFMRDVYISTSQLHSLPTTLFSLFSLLCLLTSVIWHICAGCASFRVMETAARVDYLGIGWLISASIATVVYYGFSCHRAAFTIYLSMTIIAGLAGSILPFMQWFNERKHKKWRIVFFLSLALTGFIPMVHLSTIHSAHDTVQYILPILPSLASYIFGLVFYAAHFPECVRSSRSHEHGEETEKSQSHIPTKGRWTDWIGGGSHAIWHVSIVVAILLHRRVIPKLSEGVMGEICDVWA